MVGHALVGRLEGERLGRAATVGDVEFQSGALRQADIDGAVRRRDGLRPRRSAKQHRGKQRRAEHAARYHVLGFSQWIRSFTFCGAWARAPPRSCRSRWRSDSLSRISPPLARPLVWPLAMALLMLALVRTDWSRVRRVAPPTRPRAVAVAGEPDRRAAGRLADLAGARPVAGPDRRLCLSAMAPGIISAATTATFLRLDVVARTAAHPVHQLPRALHPAAAGALAARPRPQDQRRRSQPAAGRHRGAGARGRVHHPPLRSARGCVEAGTTLDGLSVVVLMVFAIPLMDGIVARASAEPWKLLGFVGGAFAGMLLCNARGRGRHLAVPRPADRAHRRLLLGRAAQCPFDGRPAGLGRSPTSSCSSPPCSSRSISCPPCSNRSIAACCPARAHVTIPPRGTLGDHP